MNDTREKILQEALLLFSKQGYAGVSMSCIAGQLQITKAALYRHYKSKRDIFDAILKRMEEYDRRRAHDDAVPEVSCDEDPQAYANISPENICRFSLGQYRYWTADPFAAAFRKMVTLEQYHDEEMALLYENYLQTGPLEYMEDIFRSFLSSDKQGKGLERLMALEFYGPMLFLIQAADHRISAEEGERLLEEHFRRFFSIYFPEVKFHV